jgi:hypothetical protein
MSHLPPLPEPHRMLGNDIYGKEYPCYTESDMLALRAATVEACAVMCKELWPEYRGIYQTIRNLRTKESNK